MKLIGSLELGCFQASSQSIPNPNFQHLTKVRRGGGSTNLGKGITKHKRTMKQQGAERYLGGQENNEVRKSDNTPRSNEVVKVTKHEQQRNTSSNEAHSSTKTKATTKHNEQ